MNNINKKINNRIIESKEFRIEYFQYDFHKFCLYYFTEGLVYKSAKFHKEFCKLIYMGINVLFIGFRECGKTLLLKYYIIYCILYKKKRDIMLYCYDVDKSKAKLFDIAIQLQTNKKILNDFGQLFYTEIKEKKSEKKSISEFITVNEVKVKAMSIGMSARGDLYGATDGEFRPDLIGFDDIDTNRSTNNIETINKTYDFIKGEVFGGLSEKSQIIFLGNIIKNDGICLRFKEDYKNIWKILWVAIKDKDGNITRPERITEEYINIKRLDGEVYFNQNYMLIPYSGAEGLIKRQRIQYFEYENNKIKFDKIIIGVDPAISTKEKSDPFAITISGIKFENNKIKKYIIESIELLGEQKNPEISKKIIKELYNKYKVNFVVVETIAYQEVLKKILQNEGIATVEIKPFKDKRTRLMEHQIDFENGLVYFNSNGSNKLINQLIDFPNVIHDDLIDSMLFSRYDTNHLKEVNELNDKLSKNYIDYGNLYKF